MDKRLIGLKVSKKDWKIKPLSNVHLNFVFKYFLSNEDVEVLKLGYKPVDMEDKWFSYYEDGRLYCCRSWSGQCMFVVTLNAGSDEQYVTAYSYIDKRTEDLESFAMRTLMKLIPYLIEVGIPKMNYLRKIQMSILD